MCRKDLSGLKVVVTAGPTRERLDPVRYISNFSSGKMGYAIAEAAVKKGAEVVLISGPVSIEAPQDVKIVNIESTRDLLREMQNYAKDSDIVIQAAAPADYRPADYSEKKIKKQSGEEMVVRMVENPDVAATIGKEKRTDQVFVIFAAETNDASQNARGKLSRKNADMAVLNDVTKPGAGFNVDTNIATLITFDGERELPIMSKVELAQIILETALELLEKKAKDG